MHLLFVLFAYSCGFKVFSFFLSFSDIVPEKKIQVDFNAPDISSNGGIVFAGLEKDNIARKIARLIPDNRNQSFVVHSYEDMVCQRVGQILCGYEDANDCDRLRHDSALKMSVGRKPSDMDLCSQPTMTRLENHVDKKTLFEIGELFVKEYVSSFSKPPKRIILAYCILRPFLQSHSFSH